MVHFTWLEDRYTRSTNQETLTVGWIIAKPRSPYSYTTASGDSVKKENENEKDIVYYFERVWSGATSLNMDRQLPRHQGSPTRICGLLYEYLLHVFTQKEIWTKRDAAAYRTYLDDNCPASMHIYYVGWYEQRVANDSPGIRTTSWDKNIPCTLCISAEGEEARRTKQRPGTKK